MSLTLKEKVRTIIKLISEPKVLYSLVSFRSFGYLLETGWFESFKSGEPVDAELKPIPWFTYSAFDFLKEKLNSNLGFEYCGPSAMTCEEPSVSVSGSFSYETITAWCKHYGSETSGEWVFNIADFVGILFDIQSNVDNTGSSVIQLRLYPLPLNTL